MEQNVSFFEPGSPHFCLYTRKCTSCVGWETQWLGKEASSQETLSHPQFICLLIAMEFSVLFVATNYSPGVSSHWIWGQFPFFMIPSGQHLGPQGQGPHPVRVCCFSVFFAFALRAEVQMRGALIQTFIRTKQSTLCSLKHFHKRSCIFPSLVFRLWGNERNVKKRNFEHGHLFLITSLYHKHTGAPAFVFPNPRQKEEEETPCGI